MADSLPAILTSAVSGGEMMANLREIARWVKLSGTPEELESLRFLQSRMVTYGYRTEILMHDAYISLPGQASVEVDGKALQAITHSFSLPSSAGGLRGVPVYLGSGTEADFQGQNVVGKIVLLDGMATPATAQRATRAGAAGQLHISHHEHRHEMCISPVWGSPSATTLGDMPATVAATLSLADGSAIREALTTGKQPEVTIHAEVDTGWRKTPILVAEMDAPAGAEEPFIL
ncbi:MAG TPA: aminopeptidase, partial [Roseomonas sp.]